MRQNQNIPGVFSTEVLDKSRFGDACRYLCADCTLIILSQVRVMSQEELNERKAMEYLEDGRISKSMEALGHGNPILVVTEEIVRKIQELHLEGLHENLIEQLPRPVAKKIKLEKASVSSAFTSIPKSSSPGISVFFMGILQRNDGEGR
jgi:hypothetical protein